MGWRDLAGPTKRYAGTTSGSVAIPKGASVIYLEFSGGTVTGFPDGQGGTLTLTSPTTGPFTYIPMHVQNLDAATVTFSSTTQWFMELYIPAAEGQLP